MQDFGSQRRGRISTNAFEQDKRLAMWRAIYGRIVVNVEPIGDGPFHPDVTFHLLPNVSIAAGCRLPAHYRITPELLKQGRDIVALTILRSGGAAATQFDLIGGIGSASLLTAIDLSVSTLHTEGRFITLAVSRPALAELAPNLAAAFGHPIPGDNPALSLLVKYLDTVLASDELAYPDIARSASAHILDLVSLALGAHVDRADIATGGAKASRLKTIKSDILRMLDRDDLSSDMVAERHGISSRYLRKLFEENGTSFTAFLLGERLARIRRMLLDSRYGHLAIAQLAHRNGFNDISYFNRAFRRRFGTTPSDMREAGRKP
jgi:AraC-like DNA-binding protein